MKKLLRCFCLMMMVCYSLNASSATTLHFWLGQTISITRPAVIGSFGLTGSHPHFSFTYDDTRVYFKMTSFFIGCDSVTLYFKNNSGTTISSTKYYLTANQIGVILYPTSLTMNINDEETLQHLIAPLPEYSSPEATLSFSSSNTNVASVDSNGKVRAVGPGSAIITAITNYETSATCEVTVFPSMASGLNLDQTTMDLNVGATQKLTATILPVGMTNSSVTWASSDESIATVDADGNVTGVNTGLATITASTTDGSNLSASCNVIVSLPQAGFIKLDLTELELTEDETAKLTSTVMPSGSAQRVSWSSSDPTVARVVGGTVYALGWGECMITARTLDGSNITADCLVVVYPKRWPGDVNRDGIVNIEDITYLIEILINGE